jgi:hypothetical protein
VSNGIRLNPAGPDWLERASSPVLGMNAAYTKAGWIIFDGDLADGYVLMISDGGFSNYDAVYTFGSGTSARFQLECSGGSGGSSAALGSSITPGQWYYVALVRESATSLRLYVDGVLDAECTADVSGRAASAAQYLGSFGNLGGGFTLDGRLGYWRGWSTNLSASEQTDEAVSPTPVRTADLFEDWPFDPGDLVNGAANNRDWSAAGSPAADDGPPDVVTGGGGEMAAELSGSGALAAVVRGDGMLAAAPAGTSSLAAVARGDGLVAAAIAGTGTLAATARGDGHVAAALAGAAALAAAVVGDGPLACTVAGSATLAATAVGDGRLAAAIAAAATVAASLLGDGYLAAQLAGTATLAASISGGSEISATLAGAATLAAAIAGDGRLAATLTGTSALAARFEAVVPPPLVRPGPIPRGREVKSWPRWKFGRL